MNKTPKDILKEANYYLKYSYTDNTGMINVSWVENGDFVIKWNPALNTFISTWNSIDIFAPKYTVPILANITLKKICEVCEYPYDLVIMETNTNPTTSFMFNLEYSNEEFEKFKNIAMIYEDFTTYGLDKYHTELAKDAGIYEGYETIVRYYLDLNINDKSD